LFDNLRFVVKRPLDNKLNSYFNNIYFPYHDYETSLHRHKTGPLLRRLVFVHKHLISMCLGNVIRPTQSEDLFLSVRLSGVVL